MSEAFVFVNFCAKIKTMEKEINAKTIDYLMDLCRMHLSEKEKERIEKDLNTILEYVKQLQAVDTSEISLDEELAKAKISQAPSSEEGLDFDRDDLLDGFYQRRERWLEIPPIF